MKLAHAGALGPGFTGPVCFVFLLLYRGYTFVRTKKEKGFWVDKGNSNFYSKAP